MQVSGALPQPAVVTPEVIPQVEENQAMKHLEAFDHPFITEKFTEENVQNVETVGEAIKITLKGGLVITAKKEEGKLLLTGDGEALRMFAKDHMVGEGLSQGRFEAYLEKQTITKLEVNEDRSIKISSDVSMDDKNVLRQNSVIKGVRIAASYGKDEDPFIPIESISQFTQEIVFKKDQKTGNVDFSVSGGKLTKEDGTYFAVEKIERHNDVIISGTALPALMKERFEEALGEERTQAIPSEHIQSVRIFSGKTNTYRVEFDSELVGTANEVERHGWKDMKHHRVVLEKTMEMAVIPNKGVYFERGKFRMGIHIEDYEFLVRLPTSVKRTHSALYAAGYTEYKQPKALKALEFSMEIHGLTHVKDQKKNKSTFVLQGDVESEEKTLAPRGHFHQIEAKPAFDTFVFNGYKMWPLDVPGLKDVDQFPLPEEVYQDSFAHFEWQALSE